MKKPKTLEIYSNDVCLSVHEDKFSETPEHVNVDINTTFYNDRASEPKRMRQIAKWLLKSADYLDHKAKLKKGG